MSVRQRTLIVELLPDFPAAGLLLKRPPIGGTLETAFLTERS